MLWLSGSKNFYYKLRRFDIIKDRGGQTDRQTDRQIRQQTDSMNMNMAINIFCFQKNSAQRHRARKTIQLRRETESFIL